MFALHSLHHYVAILHSGGAELPSYTHRGFLCVFFCVCVSPVSSRCHTSALSLNLSLLSSVPWENDGSLLF